MSKEIMFVETDQKQQFMLHWHKVLNPDLYPKQVKLNPPSSQFDYYMTCSAEELKWKISEVLNAQYPKN